MKDLAVLVVGFLIGSLVGLETTLRLLHKLALLLANITVQ